MAHNASKLWRKRLNKKLNLGKLNKLDLHRKTGLSRTMIDAYLREENPAVPGLDTAEEIAAAFGERLADWLDDGTPPTPPEPTTAQAFERVRAALSDLIANGLDSPGGQDVLNALISLGKRDGKPPSGR